MHVSEELVKAVGSDPLFRPMILKIPDMLDCLPAAMRPFLETAEVTRLMIDLMTLSFKGEVAYEYCEQPAVMDALARVASATLGRRIRIQMLRDPDQLKSPVPVDLLKAWYERADHREA